MTRKMKAPENTPKRVWTVSEAKSRLSEVMRLAEQEGPQQIGVRRPFVVVSADEWSSMTKPHQSAGKWLVENIPAGTGLNAQCDRKSNRDIPFHGIKRE